MRTAGARPSRRSIDRRRGAMTARKITRHDMKHDEFVSFVGRITIWAEENLMTLVWGAAGILVTFGVGYAAWSWRDHTQIEGETALAQVELAFAATVGETAAAPGTESFATADEKYQTVLERADAVVEDHGSTKAAEVARYYRGLAYFEMGELEQARVHLEARVPGGARVDGSRPLPHGPGRPGRCSRGVPASPRRPPGVALRGGSSPATARRQALSVRRGCSRRCRRGPRASRAPRRGAPTRRRVLRA